MQNTIPLNISPFEIQAIRKLNARINGFLGGKIKSTKKARAVRRNGKKSNRHAA